MIGYLRGIILEKKKSFVIMDVNGVGYKVFVGENLLPKLVRGEEAELFVHTNVRENAIELFGFGSSADVDLFVVLNGVSGVGPKTALSILGTKTSEQIQSAVSKADVAFFQSVSGIGKKGAQKIIVELKGKMPGKDIDLNEEMGEVGEALEQFGFSKAEIRLVLETIDSKMSIEEQIKEGLKKLGKSR